MFKGLSASSFRHFNKISMTNYDNQTGANPTLDAGFFVCNCSYQNSLLQHADQCKINV